MTDVWKKCRHLLVMLLMSFRQLNSRHPFIYNGSVKQKQKDMIFEVKVTFREVFLLSNYRPELLNTWLRKILSILTNR